MTIERYASDIIPICVRQLRAPKDVMLAPNGGPAHLRWIKGFILAAGAAFLLLTLYLETCILISLFCPSHRADHPMTMVSSAGSARG